MQRLPRALAALALAVPAVAQNVAPAPDLEKLHAFVGQFEGSGKFVPMPGMPEMSWTSTATGRLILGGHFVQLDETIQTDFGPMEFRTVYGWDGETKKPVTFTVGAMGAGSPDLAWVDGKLVTTYHGEDQGTPFAERTVLDLTDEGYTFAMERLSGVGDSFKHVWGTVKRTSREPAAANEVAADAPTELMAPLARMQGKWDLAGKVNMMGFEMEITATEDISWRYGGAVLFGDMVGQPGDYQAQWYLAWDPAGERFLHYSITSMGQFMAGSGRVVGDQVIFTAERTQAGVPVLERSVMQVGDEGPVKAWAHLLQGAEDPIVFFEATYAKATDR